jgi:iron complex outermembrane receptor protein
MHKLLLLFTLFPLMLTAQTSASLKGMVTDEQGKPLPGATVTLNDHRYGTSTDRNGAFHFAQLPQGWYVVEASYLGCEKSTRTIHLPFGGQLSIQLKQAVHQLNEVNVNDYASRKSQQTATAFQFADREFLEQNESGSLMQTLSRLPGIGSMDIGSGNSKPVIRGLGFNRVVVAENGLRHEGQEWGHDHGLEIDQESVERIEIIKGPASLMYGSNAIVGVIDLKQLSTPARQSTAGSVELKGASNNSLAGISANFVQRGNHWYWKARISGVDYADYRVPVDSIEYMSYYFKLKNQQLRNTAGYEYNGGITVGYVGERFTSHLSLSNVFSKSGFFANAHGLEIRNSLIPYDGSDRDIDLPSQQVNHRKLMSNSFLQTEKVNFQLDMGLQQNLRKEFSEPVPHGYMPLPPDSLERQFAKSSASVHLSASFISLNRHDLKAGISGDLQHNKRGGWGFILPDFTSTTSGIYVFDNFQYSEKWMLTGGLRYDMGSIATGSYRDWYFTPADGGPQQMERARELNRTYHSLSWAAGTVYARNELQLKLNIGKSFRMPNAKELASNGLNYHMYRYERGDSTLKAEESYQFDLGISIDQQRWEMHLSPFVNYFPNYIYLNPTANYYEAQQEFFHRQSEVFRAGGEFSVMYRLTPTLSTSVDFEYIYSVQLSGEKKGYTLPFSPPANAVTALRYEQKRVGRFSNLYAVAEVQLTAAQHKIVPPEKKTPGYKLVHLRTGAGFTIAGLPVHWQLQLRNLFNTRYYDHTSFYRLIEVPGAGRNIATSIKISFH